MSKLRGGESLHSDSALTVIGEFITTSYAQKEWQNLLWKGNDPDCTRNCENREFSLWLNSKAFLHSTSTAKDGVGLGQTLVETLPGSVTGWTVFAQVIDSPSERMKVFLNGREAASGEYSSSGLRRTKGPLLIGGGGSINSGWYFRGYMRWLRIFDHALTEDEIVAIAAHYKTENLLLKGPQNSVEPAAVVKGTQHTPPDGEITEALDSAGIVDAVYTLDRKPDGSIQDPITNFTGDQEQIFVSFLYRNFHPGDVLTGVWTDIGRQLHLRSFPVVIRESHGVAGFILRRPLNGWVRGHYEITINKRETVLKGRKFDISN